MANPLDLLTFARDAYQRTKQPLKERGTVLPVGEYEDGSVGFAWPGLLAAPAQAWGRMVDQSFYPDLSENDLVQMSRDSFDAAGLAMTGGLTAAGAGMVDNALGSAGGRLAKGSADLPMDLASRMARAKERHFEPNWYHGTVDGSFDEFSGPTWVTPDANVAAHYGDRAALGRALDQVDDPDMLPDLGIDEIDMRFASDIIEAPLEGQAVMPLMVRAQNDLDLRPLGDAPSPEQLWSHLQERGVIRKDELLDDALDSLSMDNPTLWKMIEDWRLEQDIPKAGFDSVTIRDIVSTPRGAQGHDARLVFDPRNIRSVNAAFDPSKSDSANLLAANAKTGAAVPLAMQAGERAQPQGIRAAPTLRQASEFETVTPDFTPAELRTMLATSIPDIAGEMASSGLSQYRLARTMGEPFLESVQQGGALARDVKREALDSWSEAMASAKRGPTTRFNYDIISDDGGKMGVATGEVAGDTMFFDWLGDRGYGNQNALGVGGLRALREQVRADFPDVKNFQGLRVSGARGNLDDSQAALQSVYIPANAPTGAAIPAGMEASQDDGEAALMEVLRQYGLIQ